mmetsp:Transcript_12109/g.26020  ORF Transcript_12109/g.26020 Transcript_12109/m.26020 type:complete len:241 (+) Transcript_12109:667-1389(+)
MQHLKVPVQCVQPPARLALEEAPPPLEELHVLDDGEDAVRHELVGAGAGVQWVPEHEAAGVAACRGNDCTGVEGVDQWQAGLCGILEVEGRLQRLANEFLQVVVDVPKPDVCRWVFLLEVDNDLCDPVIDLCHALANGGLEEQAWNGALSCGHGVDQWNQLHRKHVGQDNLAEGAIGEQGVCCSLDAVRNVDQGLQGCSQVVSLEADEGIIEIIVACPDERGPIAGVGTDIAGEQVGEGL